MLDQNIEYNYPLKEETEKIIGLAIEVHKILGRGCLKLFIRMLWSMSLMKPDVSLKGKKNTKCFIKDRFEA
jgi:hypothetical protein